MPNGIRIDAGGGLSGCPTQESWLGRRRGGRKEIAWGRPNEEQRLGSLSTEVLPETKDCDSP